MERGHGNANNAVTSITHKNPNGTQIVQHSYTYDNSNNIVEYLNSIDGQTSYDYDFLGQLIGADYANGSISDENYTYDENGNRITANGSNYTTGDNNELTSDGTWTYTYDAEGNRISKTNSTNRELYTWDHRNRLTSVTKQEWDSVEQDWTTTQIVEYAYDYNNVWIRKVIGNSKTIFIPENYQTTVQIDNNATTHHYLWTPNQQDKLLADTTPTGISWALTDHLGTIRDILAATTTHLIYNAFGNLTSGTNPLLFGYTGKAFDADTALQNNINRWYDATTGRWLSTDPIGFNGNDTNLYRYVKNAVQRLFDVLGLASPVDKPILNVQMIRDRLLIDWNELLKDIPKIQIIEQTSECPCSLTYDHGLSGGINLSGGYVNGYWNPLDNSIIVDGSLGNGIFSLTKIDDHLTSQIQATIDNWLFTGKHDSETSTTFFGLSNDVVSISAGNISGKPIAAFELITDRFNINLGYENDAPSALLTLGNSNVNAIFSYESGKPSAQVNIANNGLSSTLGYNSNGPFAQADWVNGNFWFTGNYQSGVLSTQLGYSFQHGDFSLDYQCDSLRINMNFKTTVGNVPIIIQLFYNQHNSNSQSK